MRAERGCAWAREELSARLDGEASPEDSALLDDHLAGCAACRRHARELEDVRRALRVQPADEVPDLAPRIMRAVARSEAHPRRLPWRSRVRAATVGAAAAAAVLIGASLPWGEGPRDVAAASVIESDVRAAARNLDAFDARFEITERGWHPLVPEREMTARVRFEAPERFRLEVRDHTGYPEGRWPPNDVTVVANGRRWWIAETTSCPTPALPECSVVLRERRGIDRRQPFDGTTALPTDIVVPLETIASSGGFEVSARQEVLGRRAHRVVLDYREALPLVTSIQAGGSWRPFAATDRVDVWIDAETSFPLRFTVSRGGPPLLDVRATSFSVPEGFAPGTFSVSRKGVFKPGGWVEEPAAELPAGLRPHYTAGLLPYRAGRTADGKAMLSYASGMTWLKVSSVRADRGELGHLLTAEEIETPSGWVYYQPADASLKRRVEVYDSGLHVQLESNLSREELLRVAASLQLDGARLGPHVTTPKGSSIQRVDAAEALRQAPFAHRPSYVPPGYSAATVLLSRSIRETSVSFFFRRAEAEYGGGGIQVTQSKPAGLLTPTSEAPVVVRVGDDRARWFADRGVLEWIDDGVHVAVTVPLGDLSTAHAVANGLQ